MAHQPRIPGHIRGGFNAPTDPAERRADIDLQRQIAELRAMVKALDARVTAHGA